ncbi:DUF3551 domain-containing protein [Tardiphaga sp. P9-11]|jgi:hypothetical protein|uniref:DUF3551 domain-containing protein n=1 Tax=Tardiphaga sp. P9-11 TaxID=2024614 RepID=UPI0011F181CF|nr:DUF3551 domain-containing protein [Tardiphaga sp. P9-11]KAA0076354.1 DUF3551 domain-containing protein [Tardiphaga sp. P9-11]
MSYRSRCGYLYDHARALSLRIFVWMTIMTLNLRLNLSAFAGLGFAAFVLAGATPASAAGAQYCIAQSGANGESSYVSNCIFSDYQQCINAAVGTRGNCVGNVEYRGGAATEPAPQGRQRAR